MILRPVGGISNRLRAIMSRLDPDLVVQWPIDWECAFGDWPFESLSVTMYPVVRQPDDSFVERCDLETCDATSQPVPEWAYRYRQLVPNAEVKRLIDATGLPDGQYRAMHIRRTDHEHLAREWGMYTADDVFRAWAQAEPSPLFVATDNRETQRLVLRWRPDARMIPIETGGQSCKRGDHTRHTSLEQTVADMWICVGAREFFGTNGSSFSQTIALMRKLRGR